MVSNHLFFFCKSLDSRKKVKKAGVAAPVVEEAEVGVEGPGDDAGDEVGI